MTTYKISMRYDDYIIYHDQITAIDLSTESNSIIFFTNKDTLNFLDMNNVNYLIESNLKDKLKNFLVYKKFILVSLVILVFSVYLNTYRVQQINFNIDTPINSVIEARLQETSKRIFFFDFSKTDYQELSKDLRSEYPCYEWISITKDYDIIEVEIIKTGLDNKYEETLNGNIIASKNGVVVSYLVHSGDVLVEKNKYVEKGEILIQGGYYDTLVSPKGIVLAHTYEEESFKIYKEVLSEELTTNINSFYQINILNNLFDINKNEYVNYEDTTTEVFKIPYLFSFNKVIHYEKKEVTYFYDQTSAEEYGESKVIEKFNSSKVIDEEKIETIKVLSSIEYDEFYEITYLVKKLESIGEFQEL